MQPIIFATGNNEKFKIAHSICSSHGIELVQQPTEVDEIQSEDIDYILRDKAARAFEKLNTPVVVSDDAWSVPALKGFPGPYMKSIDHWFTPQDWLALMRNHEDQSITLIQQLAYHDGTECVVFRAEHPGRFLREARGVHGKTLQQVVSMDGDDGLSIAEVLASDRDHSQRDVSKGWRQFIDWHRSRT